MRASSPRSKRMSPSMLSSAYTLDHAFPSASIFPNILNFSKDFRISLDFPNSGKSDFFKYNSGEGSYALDMFYPSQVPSVCLFQFCWNLEYSIHCAWPAIDILLRFLFSLQHDIPYTVKHPISIIPPGCPRFKEFRKYILCLVMVLYLLGRIRFPIKLAPLGVC